MYGNAAQLLQGVPKQGDIFKSLIWDFLMIIIVSLIFERRT